jgi:cell division transport system permease protein
MHSFIRMVKSGFSSFTRNGWLSVASITVMVLTLLTLSIFFILNIVLNTGIKTIQDKIDISVYLNDGIAQNQVIDLQNDLANMSEVKSINYISKDQAMADFKAQNKDNQKLLDSLNGIDNSLPASLEIKVYDPSKLGDITKVLESDKYKSIVMKISYKENEDIINKLFRATNLTKQIGIIITIAFTLVSLIIIFNTVRIAIFSRMEEIEIMKLVGATPGFIKGPFLIEGTLYGIIATVISMVILSSILYFAAPAVANYIGGVGNTISNFLRDNIIEVLLIQLGVGIFIGVFSSWLAIRKHLKVS